MVAQIEKYCHNCFHWHWDDRGFGGHCTASCTCPTAILNKHPVPPPRFLSMEEVYGKEVPDDKV